MLLAATGTQAVTPDIANLASSRLFELLTTWIQPSRSAGDDGGYRGEVAGPVAGTLRSAIRRLVENVRETPWFSSRPDQDDSAASTHSVAHLDEDPRDPAPRTHLLCHWNC